MENQQKNNNTSNNLSLMDLVKIVWKNKIWVACITIVITIVAIIYAFVLAKPVYTSTASVIVNPDKFSGTSSADYISGLRATSTISKWIEDTTVVDATIEELNITESTNRFKNRISSESTTSDLIIYVSIEASSPEEAKLYLSTLINKSIELSNDYTQLENSYSLLGTAGDGVYSSPNKILILIVGFAGGLVLGFAFVFIKECFRFRFNEAKEVEEKLNITVIGSILNDESLEGKKTRLPISKLNQNAYEKLLSNLDFSNVGGSLKTVAFTSSFAEEGKSTTLFELANIAKKNKRKVLILDLDLRRSKVHKYFGIPRGNGVTNYVTEQASLDEVIINYSEDIDVITAGTLAPNPTIILQSSKLSDLIETLRKKYDYILIDTPPIFASSDSKIISTYSDAVVVVVAAYSTSIGHAKDTVKELKSANANLIGAVVTRLKPVGKRTYNYYYSDYDSQEIEV